MSAFALELPDELIDAVAQRVLERIGEQGAPEAGGFLDVAGAAEFLACPPSRIYALTSAQRMPHYRDGSRLLFDRGELREFVRTGGGKRP